VSRAAFLDRDGVINRSKWIDGVPKPPSGISDLEVLAGVTEAIELLKVHNYVPVVITNQPDVARGTLSQSTLNKINEYIGEITGIKHFYSCIHDDSDKCCCRKPAPGLILKSSRDLNLDIAKSFLVGDRWRDIAAGQAVGCPTFFINYSYPEKEPEMPYTQVSSLLEAVQIMIRGPYGAI